MIIFKQKKFIMFAEIVILKENLKKIRLLKSYWKNLLKAKHYAIEKNIDLVEAYKQLELGDYNKNRKIKKK